MANVLLNNLLARSLFKVVPALCVLAVGYALALTQFHATPVMVIKTLGVGNLLLLAVCACYTWGVKKPKPEVQSPKSAGLTPLGSDSRL